MRRRRRTQTVSRELLESWRQRSDRLGEKLAESPGAREAWFWKIEWDILNYLLHRYGGDTKRVLPKSGERTEAAKGLGMRHSALNFLPSGSFARRGEEGRMPRRSGDIGSTLRNIARENRERHEWLRQLYKEEAELRRRECDEGLRETYRIVFEAFVKHVDAGAKMGDQSRKEIERMLAEILEWEEAGGVSERGSNEGDGPAA